MGAVRNSRIHWRSLAALRKVGRILGAPVAGLHATPEVRRAGQGPRESAGAGRSPGRMGYYGPSGIGRFL